MPTNPSPKPYALRRATSPDQNPWSYSEKGKASSRRTAPGTGGGATGEDARTGYGEASRPRNRVGNRSFNLQHAAQNRLRRGR